jgi:ketosteroid isomerase-like protein
MSAESIVKDFLAALNAHDGATMGTLLAEDVVEENLDVFTATGAEQVLAMHEALANTYPDVRSDDTEILASGPDYVVYRGIVRGTQTGALNVPGGPSFPPSGNKVAAHVLGFVQLRDDKISRITVGYNAGLIFAQIEGKAHGF